jgi:hypothetical protein
MVCDNRECENVILLDKQNPDAAYQPPIWKEKNYVIRATKPVT